jgi:hypothetical protein
MSDLLVKFKKRGSKDLSKKLESGKCSAEEKEVITSILVGRGVLEAEKPKAKVKKPSKKKAPKMSSEDIICDFLSVGQTAKFIAKSRDDNNGKEIEATVIKIYNCGRTGKEYVRLKADGHTYHKRLNTFEPVAAE